MPLEVLATAAGTQDRDGGHELLAPPAGGHDLVGLGRGLPAALGQAGGLTQGFPNTFSAAL